MTINDVFRRGLAKMADLDKLAFGAAMLACLGTGGDGSRAPLGLACTFFASEGQW
jgi:hypothetical protein